jgi:hypothetical protein
MFNSLGADQFFSQPFDIFRLAFYDYHLKTMVGIKMDMQG